jgi:hypothetical protein
LIGFFSRIEREFILLLDPFSLTFGKKANTFRDWRNEPDKNSELELIARSQEIKNLFDRKRPLALENIAKSQEAQKTSQDKRHNVLIGPLAIGTKVMVKNHDKLVKKLEARYRGPNTVVSVTKDHNYLLKDVLGAH